MVMFPSNACGCEDANLRAYAKSDIVAIHKCTGREVENICHDVGGGISIFRKSERVYEMSIEYL